MGEVGSRRNLAAALVFAVAAACSQSPEDRGPTATVPSAPTTSAQTADPYAVPEVIDVAYVNRVLAGLDAVMGDVVRLVVKSKTIPPEAYDRLRAIYGDDELLQLRVDSFQDDQSTGFHGYRATPGNQTTSVSELLAIRPDCVFARVDRDYSAVGALVQQPQTEWVALKLRPSLPLNPTQWVYVFDGLERDGSGPTNPCD